MIKSGFITTRPPVEHTQSEHTRRKASHGGQSKSADIGGKSAESRGKFGSSQIAAKSSPGTKNTTASAVALLQKSPLLTPFKSASPEKRAELAEIVASSFSLKPRGDNKINDQQVIDRVVNKILALVEEGNLGKAHVNHKPLPGNARGYFKPSTNEIAVDPRKAKSDNDLTKTLLEEFGESIDPNNPKGSRGDSGESFLTNLQRSSQGKPLVGEAEKLLKAGGLSKERRTELEALKKEDDRLRAEDDSFVLKNGANVRLRAVDDSSSQLPRRTVEKTVLGRQGYLTKEDQARIDNRGPDANVYQAFPFLGNVEDLKPEDIIVRPPVEGLDIDAPIHGIKPVVVRYPGSAELYGSFSPGGLQLRADISRYSHHPSEAVSLVARGNPEDVRSGKDKDYDPIAKEDRIVFNGDTETYRSDLGRIVDPFASHISSLATTVRAELALQGKTFSTEGGELLTEAESFEFDLGDILRDISLLAVSNKNYIGVNVVKHPQHGLQLGFFETDDPNKAPVIDTNNLVSVDKVGEIASRLREGEKIKNVISIVSTTEVKDEISIPKGVGKVTPIWDKSGSASQKLRIFDSKEFHTTNPPTSFDNIDDIVNLSFSDIAEAAEKFKDSENIPPGAKKIDDALKLLYLADNWDSIGIAHDIDKTRVKKALGDAIKNDQDVKDFITTVHNDRVKEVTGKTPEAAALDIMKWLDSEPVKKYYDGLSEPQQVTFRNGWVSAAGLIDPKTTLNYINAQKEDGSLATLDKGTAEKAIGQIVDEIPDGQDERLDVTPKLLATTLDIVKLSGQSTNRLGDAVKIPIKFPKRVGEVGDAFKTIGIDVKSIFTKEKAAAPLKEIELANLSRTQTDAQININNGGEITIETDHNLPENGQLNIEADPTTGEPKVSVTFKTEGEDVTLDLNVVEGEEIVESAIEAVQRTAADDPITQLTAADIVNTETFSELSSTGQHISALQAILGKEDTHLSYKEGQVFLRGADGRDIPVAADELTLKRAGKFDDARIEATLSIGKGDAKEEFRITEKLSPDSKALVENIFLDKQLQVANLEGYEKFNAGIKEWLDKPIRQRTEENLLRSLEKNVGNKEQLTEIYKGIGIENADKLKAPTLGKEVLGHINGIVAAAGLVNSIGAILLTARKGAEEELSTSDKLALAGTVFAIPGQVEGTASYAAKIINGIRGATGLTDDGARILQQSFSEGAPAFERAAVNLTAAEKEALDKTLIKAGFAEGLETTLDVEAEALKVSRSALAEVAGSTAVKQGLKITGVASSALFAGFFIKDAIETDDKTIKALDALAGASFAASALLGIAGVVTEVVATEEVAATVAAFTGPLGFVAEAVGLAVAIAITVEGFKKQNKEIHKLNQFVEKDNAFGQNFFR